MILPIIGYGHQGLREETKEIGPDYPKLDELIDNMFETMYNAQGVGLACPQVNIPIRLFVVDGSSIEGMEGEDMIGFKRVFINPRKVEETGTPWTFEEGCLSIPDIRENVTRPAHITLRYQDPQFETHTETFVGMQARIVQHEYDHLEGKLFVDYLSGMRKRVLKTRLNKISQGKVDAPYPMKYPRK
jgi:peptide deformylase